jgi:hypothetical protein
VCQDRRLCVVAARRQSMRSMVVWRAQVGGHGAMPNRLSEMCDSMMHTAPGRQQQEQRWALLLDASYLFSTESMS